MKSTGVLVKLSGPLDGHRAALAAAVPAEHEIQPLFTVAAAPPPPGQAAAAGPQHTWVSVRPRGDGLAAAALGYGARDPAPIGRPRVGCGAGFGAGLAARRAGRRKYPGEGSARRGPQRARWRKRGALCAGPTPELAP